MFAVVGHVGSGTSEIASALKGLLSGATGGSFDVEILKAREVIRAWAVGAGLQTPTTEDNDLSPELWRSAGPGAAQQAWYADGGRMEDREGSRRTNPAPRMSVARLLGPLIAKALD